ncbi:MAG TPA: zinc-binding dehydrogenase [Acidimicrobiales bacterium]
MYAVVIVDGRLQWEERDDPVPGDTELLVSVRAAGINNADLVQRAGFYPAPPGWPQDIPGMEFAGEVVGIGRQVTSWKAGDRVMAVVGGGAQATLAIVDETHASAVPETLSWPEAGGFSEIYWTAYDALFTQAGLSAGERVLVSGAAGGVGTAGVQLAAATGASVVATVRDAARRAEVGALGALVIEPGQEADHGPYDVVLELVGAASLTNVLPSLAIGARVVVIGVGGGGRMELDLLQLMQRRARIGASTMRARSRREKANMAAGIAAHVLPLLADGRVRVPVCDTFPLAEAEAAYERFGAGKKFGKIVLTA